MHKPVSSMCATMSVFLKVWHCHSTVDDSTTDLHPSSTGRPTICHLWQDMIRLTSSLLWHTCRAKHPPTVEKLEWHNTQDVFVSFWLAGVLYKSAASSWFSTSKCWWEEAKRRAITAVHSWCNRKGGLYEITHTGAQLSIRLWRHIGIIFRQTVCGCLL